jgi:hypothetical protein
MFYVEIKEKGKKFKFGGLYYFSPCVIRLSEGLDGLRTILKNKGIKYKIQVKGGLTKTTLRKLPMLGSGTIVLSAKVKG